MKNHLPVLLLGALALTATTSCEKDAEEPQEYSISVTAGPGGRCVTQVEGVAAARAPQGANVTLTATPDEGYTFGGWTAKSGGIELSGNPVTFIMPGEDVSVKAMFTAVSAPVYTVTVSDDGHGKAEATFGGNTVTEAQEGAELTLAATPGEGYTFGRWIVESGDVELSDETATPATFTMPAENVSVRAEFAEVPVNVFDRIIDPGFLFYCKEIGKFDTDGDGVLSLEEAQAVTEINVDKWYQVVGTPIVSLAGIEYFTSLTYLTCYGNALTEIDVSKNTELTYLHVGTNQLTELDVTKNTKLVDLSFNKNPIAEIDLSKCPELETLYFTECSELTALDVSHNSKLAVVKGGYCPKITSLDFSNNPAVTNLDCYEGQLASLDVSKCTGLKVLNCFNNKLTSLDISKCTALTNLQCLGNQLTSLDVSNCTALEYLTCHNNRMTELDASAMAKPNDYTLGCGVQTSDGTTPQTLMLTLRDEQKPHWEVYMEPYQDMNANVEVVGEGADVFQTLTDPVFREYCKRFDTDNNGKLSQEEAAAVTEIIVSGMGIKAIDGLSYFTGLRTLVCNNNELTALNVAVRDSKLESLVCNDNKLTELIISKGYGGESLLSVSCQNNQLTALSVAGCRKLRMLECQNNRLSGLGLNLNFTKQLVKVNCSNNNLTKLWPDSPGVLEQLDCRDNELTDLNLPNYTALISLMCNTNNLTTLNISGSTSLMGVMAHEHRLTTLDASDMASPGGYNLFCGSQTSDGSTAQTLTLTLREEQKPHWENNLKGAPMNSNVVLAD